MKNSIWYIMVNDMSLKEQALKLYMLCFPEDSEQFARRIVERCFETNCRYIEENGQIISMLFLLDCDIIAQDKKLEAYYLYAAATHPGFRGQGYMTKLINQVKSSALRPIITKPADEGLFSFYRALGFEDAFYFSEKLCERKTECKISLRKTTVYDYKTIREKLLTNTPHVLLGDVADMELSSLTLLAGEDTCCAVDLDEEIPIVKEIISNRNNAEDAVLSFLNKLKAVFRTTEFSAPFAMLYAPDGTNLPPKMYMGLAMD